MESDIHIVIENSKALEALLREHFGGRGRGLGQILNSIAESAFPVGLRKSIFRIARTRNRVVHTTTSLADRHLFSEECLRAMRLLTRIVEDRSHAANQVAYESIFGVRQESLSPDIQAPLSPSPPVVSETETDEERALRLSNLREAVRRRIQSDPYDPRIKNET